MGWQAAGYANTASLWWNPLVYSFPLTQLPATAPQYSDDYFGSLHDSVLHRANPGSQFLSVVFHPATPGFKSSMPTLAGKQVDPGFWYARPQCNPLIQTPVTAASLAEMAPYFLQHCSQFVVEYAGDYMQQVAPGTTGPPERSRRHDRLGPDGQIDFYLDANGNKHIRWYGMPRSSTGPPHLDQANGNLVLIRGYDHTTDRGKAANSLPSERYPQLFHRCHPSP